jgi:radical SAM protein with 4Fe4S-binding SPASM domain
VADGDPLTAEPQAELPAWARGSSAEPAGQGMAIGTISHAVPDCLPFAGAKERNSERLADDIAAGRLVFRSLPEVVSLHTTEICNLRCIMCKRSTSPGRRSLEREALDGVLEALFPTARLAIVSGFLGEPMMAGFDPIVAAARRFGVKLELVTNGTLLTGSRYREIRDTLAAVNVSMDSHVPHVYERIRRGGRHDALLANLHGIQEERRSSRDGVVFSLSAVVMRSNMPHLPGFVRFAAGLGADAVHLQPLRQFDKRTPEEDPFPVGPPAWRRGAESGCPSPLADSRALTQAILDCERDVRSAAMESGINLYFSDFCAPPIEHRRLVRRAAIPEDNSRLCWNVGRGLAVFPTGDVYPCCHPTDHVLGNVYMQDVRSIWNDRAARRLRRAHFSGRGTAFCRGCLRAPYLRSPQLTRTSAVIRGARLALASARNACHRRWATPRRR